MFESRQEPESRTNLRRLDLSARAQLRRIDASEDGTTLTGLQGQRTLLRFERRHRHTFGVEQVIMNLRNRLALDDADLERVRQHAFHRHALDRRDQLQVALYARQIEREQILFAFDTGPAAQLLERNNA